MTKKEELLELQIRYLVPPRTRLFQQKISNGSWIMGIIQWESPQREHTKNTQKLLEPSAAASTGS